VVEILLQELSGCVYSFELHDSFEEERVLLEQFSM
jgi:hypothetical protein